MTDPFRSKKRPARIPWLLVAGSLVAGSLVTAGAATGQTTTTPARKVLRLAIPGDENNITPYTTTGRSLRTQDLLNLIYDTLLYSPFQEKPEPWLATSVEKSVDNRTWTFRLRSGVTWHDGRPFTADDVKFTWDYFFKTQQGRYSHHVNDRPYMESSRIVDPATVSFTCREACPTFDIDPGADLPILPKHIWENVSAPATFTADLPVGTGPFKLVDRQSEQSYRFTANETYFKGKPLVDEIQMPIIKESAAMFLALRSGQVDAVTRVVPPESVTELERNGVKVIRMADYGSVQININTQRVPFTNPKFRKALSLGTNTDLISQTLIGAEGKPGVDSMLDPDSPFANTSLKHEFNVQKARQFLDELDFRDRNNDGIRETPEGQALNFEILVSSLEAREVRASELVATQLKEIGVGIKVNGLDPVAVNTRRTPKDAAGRPVPQATQTGDYDFYVTQYSGGHFHFDPDGLLYVLHCPGQTGFGAYIAGYCNKDFDALVDRAAVLGSAERKPLLAQAQQILMNEPPFISLYFPDGTFAYRPGAFDGYIQEVGHGIFHKRSFLPGPRATAAPAVSTPAGEDDAGGGGSAVPFVLVAALAVAAGGFVLSRRKKTTTAQPGTVSGPEVD